MPSLFEMTAPCTLRCPEDNHRIMAEVFPHPKGLMYFDLYWHIGKPQQVIHVVEGEIKGDGPWKIGDCVANVLGCHGSDPELAAQYQSWQDFIQRADAEYPPRPLIEAIARKAGASIQD